MAKTLGITGHRKFGKGADTEWAWNELEAALARAEEKGFATLRTGMAPGTDIIAAELALAVGVGVHPVIPFPRHALTPSFNKAWRDRYYLVLQKVTGFEYIAGNEDEFDYLLAEHEGATVVAGDGYHKGAAYQLRDRVLADKCHAMLAVRDNRSRGGTVYTMNYALEEVGIPVFRINPMTRTSEWVFP